LATIVTPNVPEAQVLTGLNITSIDMMKEAAKRIVDQYGAKSVVVKGGHMQGDPIDVFYSDGEFVLLEGQRVHTRHTHGTGCTYSAAIAAELAKGRPLHEAVNTAKAFITCAIRDELGIGGGHGPTNHWAYARQTGNKRL